VGAKQSRKQALVLAGMLRRGVTSPALTASRNLALVSSEVISLAASLKNASSCSCVSNPRWQPPPKASTWALRSGLLGDTHATDDRSVVASQPSPLLTSLAQGGNSDGRAAPVRTLPKR
jgi:hypothetical protein